MKSIIIIGISIVLVVASFFSVDIGLFGSYALMGIAVGAAIILPLIKTLQSPGEIKKAGIALAGMLVLFVVAYLLAGDEVHADQAAKGITATTSKLVGAGLIMFYLISVIALIGLVYSEVNKALK